MLTSLDREVVARDPGLPGLALLLDDDRLLECLRQSWPEQPPESLECTYLRYKPGINCLAGYVAHTADGPLPFYAKARTAEHHARVRIGDAAEVAAIPPGPSQLLDETRIVLRHFPDDRKLRGLARLMLTEPRLRLLRKMLPEASALWSTRPDTLRYKPERRYVARLLAADEPQAVIKIYDEHDFGNALQGATAFATREHLRIARRIGRSKRHRAIVSQWLPGRPLDEWLRATDFDPGRMRDVGVALAELHRQTPDHLARLSRENQSLAVLMAANGAAWLHPALAERLRELALRVAARLLAEPAAGCAIHGDFNAEQVIWDTNGIGIIDYDQAGLGDPAADFGSFIARLEYEELSGRLPAGRSDGIVAGLLDGYCHRARCSRPARIELHVAAGLLQLTPHPFRDREPDWPERIEGLLNRAERALGGSAR